MRETEPTLKEELRMWWQIFQPILIIGIPLAVALLIARWMGL